VQTVAIDRRIDDVERVTELLGRRPRGRFEVVVRAPDGDPIVIRNEPLFDDGTPMPTRYWLVGKRENELVGRLESRGGVNAVEAELGLDVIAEAHERYRGERDAALADARDLEGEAIPVDAPRPSGGVGGTRVGVKCLHAHYANHLMGADDPVGRWVQLRLAAEGNAYDPSQPGLEPR
jgi:hypothetical protein